MSIDQQIAANEKTFQEWFQRSWDAHHKESPSAADFKDVGDPRPTTRQKSYDYLDKRTVRVMADFQSRPDDFVQLLQDYLINNALLLYQDSIRIANVPGSVSFFKNCGDQIGMVECHLSREGQVVTVSIGDQIYSKSVALMSDPSIIKNQGGSVKDKTQIQTLNEKRRNLYLQALVIWAGVSFFVLLFLTVLYYVLFIYRWKDLPDGFIIFYIAAFLCGGTVAIVGVFFILFGWISLFRAANDERKDLAVLVDKHNSYDLSHKFFPVAYYSNEGVTAAQTQNKDHAAFLERIRSVIDRAVAFGESSHNQRT